MRSFACLSVVAVTGLCGCTSSTRDIAPPLDFAPREVVEVARFAVRHDGEPLGALVQLEIRDPTGPVRFWRIENLDGAWVGHATAQGRFSRRLPFRDDDQDLGVWPLAQGVAELFDRHGAVELRELPVAAPAAGRKR